MMKREVYFLRHGETEQNLLGIVQGSGIDSHLNENGLQQASLFYEKYKSEHFDLIVHSNLIRTRQTIQHFLTHDGYIENDARIREICWGEHEGKAGEPELMAKYYQIINAWTSGDYHAKPVGGESAFELGERLTAFIRDLEKKSFQKALICTHGRTLRALICLLRQWSLSKMEEIEHSNTGLYHGVVRDGTWHFIRKNDLSHLNRTI